MLTVRLLRAPDYPDSEYFTLCSLLHSLPMPGWTFQATETQHFAEDAPYYQHGRRRPEEVHFNYHSPVEKKMYTSTLGRPLSFQELFDTCTYYRQVQPVDSNDFVVLLTNRPNALNWFSAFNRERNIFVHTGDWDMFMNCPPQHPVAYELIANVLQSQMKLNMEEGDECLHQETIGCMNDFCVQKTDTIFKLRTADICAACSERLHHCEVSDHLVEGAAQGFESLRKQMLFSQGFKRHAGPGTLEVTWLYEFRFPGLGNLSFQLAPLARVLYAFFLNHPAGVDRAGLCDYRNELSTMYGRLTSRNQVDQNTVIDRLLHLHEGSFNENRSRINKEIIKKLGERLAEPYLISGEAGGVYKIEIGREKVTFLKS